ncbi:MAG: hypothetical protein HDT46_02100 [Ruminococcaceae bacterium]|nr:hypothetical protein [Oscillospiraceae bacterium]
MFKLDLKTMRLPLLIYFFTSLAAVGIAVFIPSLFEPHPNGDEVYKSFMFYFTDFFLPFSACAAVIMQIGGTLEKQTFSFFCSLPVKENVFLRWLITFLICAAIFAVTVITMFFSLKSRFNFKIELERMFFISFSNLIYFCSLSLLLIIITRQIFYAFSFLYGYMFVDMLVGENLMREKSAFVNIIAQCSKEAIDVNKKVYYIISLAVLIISFVLVKIDFMRKVNRRI